MMLDCVALQNVSYRCSAIYTHINYNYINCVSGKPGAPADVHVTDVYKDSCALSWVPPLSDGGTDITGYHVEVRAGRSAHWTRVTVSPVCDTRHNISRLSPATSYEFRVIAENRKGCGEPSMPCLSFVTKDPWATPAAPDTPTITDVTKRSCTLSWRAPTRDGGDAVSGYAVEYREAGTSRWTRANEGDRSRETTYKVTGLHTDYEYEFRVAAENRAGVGAFSDASRPVFTRQHQGEYSRADTPLAHRSAWH